MKAEFITKSFNPFSVRARRKSLRPIVNVVSGFDLTVSIPSPLGRVGRGGGSVNAGI